MGRYVFAEMSFWAGSPVKWWHCYICVLWDFDGIICHTCCTFELAVRWTEQWQQGTCTDNGPKNLKHKNMTWILNPNQQRPTKTKQSRNCLPSEVWIGHCNKLVTNFFLVQTCTCNNPYMVRGIIVKGCSYTFNSFILHNCICLFDGLVHRACSRHGFFGNHTWGSQWVMDQCVHYCVLLTAICHK